jgi:hypothetical protein
MLQLGALLENHHTNPACFLIIKNYIGSYLDNTKPEGINILVPDTTIELKQANLVQQQIGWDQWLKR